MSDTDSFINEVAEEVRRDRLYKLARRYGWIAVTAVVLIVGGAAWNEVRKSNERTEAQAFGDAILTALGSGERSERAEALAKITAPSAGGEIVLGLLTSAEEGSDQPEQAATRLLALADSADVPQAYRQLATLKAMMIEGSGIDDDTRRTRLEGLALAGGVVRLLAEEQLALMDAKAGNTEAAVDRLQNIVRDAEATSGLRQRASQVIVALGSEPEF